MPLTEAWRHVSPEHLPVTFLVSCITAPCCPLPPTIEETKKGKNGNYYKNKKGKRTGIINETDRKITDRIEEKMENSRKGLETKLEREKP